MREHLVFLETSSAAVKLAAWIFLLLGIAGGLLIIAGRLPGKTIQDAVINFGIGLFLFFFLYLIAKIADLLVKIINAIGGSLPVRQAGASGGNEIKKE